MYSLAAMWGVIVVGVTLIRYGNIRPDLKEVESQSLTNGVGHDQEKLKMTIVRLVLVLFMLRESNTCRRHLPTTRQKSRVKSS